MSYFKATVHQNPFRVRLTPHWGSSHLSLRLLAELSGF